MADNLTARARSERMSRIRGRDTAPEWIVRRLLHGLGYRFRLHRKDLPGRPDLVFLNRNKVVFVHGCFWHGHGCKIGRLPKSNLAFWEEKISRNQSRDARNIEALCANGWTVLIVWQCEMKDREALAAKLVSFLGATRIPRSTNPPRIDRLESMQESTE